MTSASVVHDRCTEAAYWPVKRLPGKCQSLLLSEQASGKLWVFKPDDGAFLLANEFVGRYVYSSFGISVPTQRITDARIGFVPQLWEEQDQHNWRREKKHLLLRYVPEERGNVIFDFVPPDFDLPLFNLEDFLGAFLLDICLCNADVRQAVFVPKAETLEAVFIDHSHLFGEMNAALLKVDFRVWPKRSFAQLALIASEDERVLTRWLGLMAEFLPGVIRSAFHALPQEWARRDSHELINYVEFRLDSLQRFVPLELERLRQRERKLAATAAQVSWLGF